MRLVLLAHPAHPRVASMQAALAAQGLQPAVVIAYRDWLAAPACLLALLDQPCWLKLEAPGEDAWLQDALIGHGARLAGMAPPPPLQHGQLAHGALWQAGFATALHGLATALQSRPWVHCVNTPAAILAMGDKLACQQLLQQQGVAVPVLLGAVAGFDDLQARMQQQRLRRVFVKPRYGSSAAGVVALQTDGKGRFLATTPVEMLPGTAPLLFNSLRIRRYHGQAVADLIDALAPEALYAEAWVPKPPWPAGAGKQHFDIRVLTLHGQAAHRVARVAAQPLTNLHLGNQRGAVDLALAADDIQRLENTAARAAACFAGSMVAGIDVIVARQRCHVLEVNAFGDWLPRLQWRGHSVHDAQVAMLAALWPQAVGPATSPQAVALAAHAPSTHLI